MANVLALTLLLVFLPFSANGQGVAPAPAAPTESAFTQKRFAPTCEGGYYRMPGFLLGTQLVRHPKSLNGISYGCGFGISVTRGWRIGVEMVNQFSSGDGLWERPSTASRLAEEGVAGEVTGHLNLRLRGLTIFGEKVWRQEKRFRPFMRFGLGPGWIKADFQGRFEGHETRSGFNFPISEPAYDSFSAIVPIISLKGGIRARIVKDLFLSASPCWNTGFCTEGALRYQF